VDVGDVIRVYPPIGIEVPPASVLLDHEEVHSVRKRADLEELVRIEFYQTTQGKYFVWPYVGEVRRGGDSYRHFSLRRHFDNMESARESALNQGQMLTELGSLGGIPSNPAFKTKLPPSHLAREFSKSHEITYGVIW
jgi:hypothetical protein